MHLYEVQAFGFDGSTDATDDHILWVAAPRLKEVLEACYGCHALVQPLPYNPDNCRDWTDFTLPKDAGALTAKLKRFLRT